MTNDEFRKDRRYNRVYGKGMATPEGRFSWPSLDKPKDPPPVQPGQEQGKPRYEVTLLLEKTKAQAFVNELQVKAKTMCAMFNEGNSVKLAEVSVVKDGDAFDLEKYPYYKGHYVLVARNAKQPKIWNKNKQNMNPAEIYGGQLGKLVVVPHLGPTGLSFRLEIVQLVLDDQTRFGGTKENYDDLLDDDEDDDSGENGEEVAVPQTQPQKPALTPEQLQMNLKAQASQKKQRGLDAAISKL